jgi:son of sevenless-like protein
MVARTRSAGELNAGYEKFSDANPQSMQSPRSRSNVGHRPSQQSVASISSASSSHSTSTESSGATAETPPTPPFPSGPASAAEIMDNLRYTHNQYLSTIAAFVGQSHSHSRSSHASNTAHMFDLAREIVEMVCRMLTVLDAVARHPGLPPHKLGSLRAAKEGLYTVTRAFAESVRILTQGAGPRATTEEEERATLQRAATDALKAGAECVSAIKMALTRMPREEPLVVSLSEAGFEFSLTSLEPSKVTAPGIVTDTSALHALYRAQGVEDDQDLTIQAQTPMGTPLPPRLLATTISPITPISSTPASEYPPFSVIVTDESQPPARSMSPEDGRAQSPASVIRTDGGTTWEGSTHDHAGLEEKLMQGDLPALPAGAETAEDEWMFAHEYAIEDVAYNSDGILVGATLAALVEKMTPHDGLVDGAFAAVFFMTFRLFASPPALVQAVIDRYNLLPPAGLTGDALRTWQAKKGIPVRLRVTSLLKLWLDGYWRPAADAPVLPTLAAFGRDALAKMFPGPAQRLLDALAARARAGADAAPRTALPPPPSAGEVPRPVVAKTLFAALRARTYGAITVTDFEPLELARQFTVMEHALFGAIGPDEVLDMGGDGARNPASVRRVTGLSTAVTGWVSESILKEMDTKKRTALVKFFIKLADVRACACVASAGAVLTRATHSAAAG